MTSLFHAPNQTRFWLSLMVGLLLLGSCRAEDTRSVTVTGYNYPERPIYTCSVNGAGGSNIFVGGGGAKMSCCTEVTVGKPAVIKWTYSRTKKQYLAGVQKENRSTTVIVPPPEVADVAFLEVHFYPDDHVELALVNSLARPAGLKSPIRENYMSDGISTSPSTAIQRATTKTQD